ncbi:hypothetical protein J1N35_008357 [Gossypium stocksii]|uniref:Uncharacterized protein n=1 Tax=Gossypium stocksii TaxID=47602 RepID=A0A9D3W807_9ROSI|nr:hypothetical protein J1N35_008357 [Gossypium stocksii]
MAYNAIFGSPIMQIAMMMITTFYMKIKFPTKTGVGFIRFDPCLARQCHMLPVK